MTKIFEVADFPKINMRRETRYLLNEIPCKHADKIRKKEIFRRLRNVSTAFINRKDVKHSILSRDGYKCKICGSVEFLQIDHIVSVFACFHGEIHINELNKESNLQTLCRSCNAAKIP